ncbi:hypothetical protein C8F04DRAFT_1131782 [Mycena alexandri]|uniref:Uncharacterized protein n=1 Tax=Mycena alexandri TaxID=1745969 RepID=A0AAD6SAR1_9AGAR|nr:hypothetical protein C8F04DRAFT_1131782 [Mycena alexandri]
MASVLSTAIVVEALKAEANVLHGQGNYQGAYQKYSEAIKEKQNDPRILSILFANRAASCLGMKEYLDALSDGQKAAQTDPSYVKGWALEEWNMSRRAWTSALERLPETDLSPAEVTGLKAADAAQATRQASVDGGKYHHEIPLSASNDFPWMRALALAEQEKLILNSMQPDFIRGMTAMRQMVVKNRRGHADIQSSPSVLTDLTNGILRDERVFHAYGQFFDQLENQIQFEVRLTNAWGIVGPKQIEKEVPERLRKLGWLPVRRALAITVRIWLMKGFLDSNMGAFNGGVEFYKRILDVLEWGRRTYPDVPSEERGVIFEGSFVRGVRRLYIPAVLSLHRKNGDSCGYTLEDIRDLAEDLKAETEASPRTPDSYLDSGFYASFWVYPIAEALSIIGWYHMQLGFRRIDKQQGFDPEANDDFLKSSEYYIQAAEKHPMDDEKHPYFLAVAVEALWWGGAKLEVILPVCRRIRAAMPEADEIWACSQMAKTNRNFNCLEAIIFLEKCEDEIAEGTLALDMALAPSDLLERRIGKLA